MVVELELDEIQGNILAGFNKPFGAFLIFQLPANVEQATAWLADVLPEITTTTQVNSFKAERAAALESGEEPPTATWTNIGFTREGLERLGVASREVKELPNEFREGMRERADVIGDVGENAPDNWVDPFKPGSTGAVHALLIIGSDEAADRNYAIADLVQRAKAHGVDCLFQQVAMLRQDAPGREHFGFKDGISQPGVEGFTDKTRPGQDCVRPGEFVIGYPREPSPSTVSQTADSTSVPPTWLKNGSFLVFRRLSQDVPGFEEFVHDSAPRVGMSEELLRAKLLGRYRSGAPLVGANDNTTDPGLASAEILAPDRINDFLYAQDADGQGVPRAAHIRKVFPRDQEVPGTEEVRSRRIMRRGLPFGPSFVPSAARRAYGGAADDRGLCFVCYQQSIAEQFEFIQQKWVNDHSYPQTDDGVDPFASQMVNHSYSMPGNPATSLEMMTRWVTTTGGEYFFAPSIGAMKQFAGVS